MMGTEVNPSSDKSRRERRKEVRLSKNKKKFDSWVHHHHQSKKISSSGDNANKKLLTKNNGEPPQIVKKTKSVVRDSGAMEQARPVEFRKSGSRKELKRKKDSSTTPKSNFFELLEMDMKGRGAVSEDEDLRLERKLAKKLKVKHGRLNAANDDLDMLLDGIPSALYDISPTKGHDHAISLKHEMKDSVDEDLKDDDEINDSENDGEINDSEEDDDEINDSADEDLEDDDEINDSADEDLEDDDEISSNDGDEESEISSDDEDETENHGDRDLTEGNLALERKLTKKEKKSLDNSTLAEQEKRAQTRITSNIEASGPSGKYVAPHLRSNGVNESAEHAQVRKRVRGLLNRLSETNVESISGEISALYHSVGHSVGSQIITEEVVASCSGGPRGNEQYAAVFAAFVAGMACLVGIDFGGKLLVRVAKCFEEEYLKEDNLSLRNLTLLLSYLYFFGVCSSELIYDFLIMLGKRLTEVDVSTVLTVLQCCGMKLRGDDPVGMKNFILSVQSRVNELKASSENAESNINSKRMEFMLETICDIKNNKKRSKEDTVQHTRIKKWLQKLRGDDILIRGLKWGKLLDPNKKGQWWLTGDIASTTENVEEVAGTIDKEIPETKKMLQLAASQRMNTDARRAIFCVIMSGDDYIDAFVKLLRLDLPGKQDREIMRVLVECCLQEKVFNKYYCVLASKLCKHDKNHKFTLQYCLWDHFKELESMPLIRSMHLAKFVAEMVKSFTLSLAVLKVVELGDLIHLTAKRIMHYRMLFETILESSDKRVWKIFTRIAVMPEHESLRSGVEFFIRKYVVSVDKSLASKFKIAKKALSNVEGVVM